MRRLALLLLLVSALALTACASVQDLQQAAGKADAALAEARQVKSDADAQVKVLSEQAATRPADPTLQKTLASYQAASTQAAPAVDKLAMTAAQLHARLEEAGNGGDALSAGLQAGADAATLIPKWGGIASAILGIAAAVYQGWRRRRAVDQAALQTAAAAQSAAQAEAVIRSIEAAKAAGALAIGPTAAQVLRVAQAATPGTAELVNRVQASIPTQGKE